VKRSILLILFFLVLLTACNPFAEPDTMLTEYQSRLSRVIDSEPAQLQPVTITGLPRLRERLATVEKVDVNFLEFLSLHGCELQVLIAEKNSIMGKVMTPINELRYQVSFIQKGKQCLMIISDSEMQQSLQQIITLKVQQLPAHIWNAVWVSEGITGLMTRSKGYLPILREESGVDSASQSLHEMLALSAELREGNYATDLGSLGKIQQQWHYGHQIGQLLNSMSLLTEHLTSATAMLKHRIDEQPICYKKQASRQATVMNQFFMNIYIGKVQPYIAIVSQAADQLLPLINRLAEGGGTANFRQYVNSTLSMDSKDSLYKRYVYAVKQHTQAWQALLDQCGMRPAVN